MKLYLAADCLVDEYPILRVHFAPPERQGKVWRCEHCCNSPHIIPQCGSTPMTFSFPRDRVVEVEVTP